MAWYLGRSSGLLFQRISGCLRITPSPEHGASTSIPWYRSVVLRLKVCSSPLRVVMGKVVFDRSILSRSNLKRLSLGSTATRVQVSGSMSANCSVLPPRPAQASRYFPEWNGARREGISCAPSSCTEKRPSV